MILLCGAIDNEGIFAFLSLVEYLYTIFTQFVPQGYYCLAKIKFKIVPHCGIIQGVLPFHFNHKLLYNIIAYKESQCTATYFFDARTLFYLGKYSSSMPGPRGIR